MTVTVVGVVVDELGHALRTEAAPTANGRGVEVRRSCYGVGAAAFRPEQAGVIPVDLDHDEAHPVGSVAFLERRDGYLWAVAVVDVDGLADLPDPLYYSGDVTHHGDADATLSALALTHRPASIAPRPVEVMPGDLRHAADNARWGPTKDRLTRALRYDDEHRAGHPHVIAEQRSVDAPANLRLDDLGGLIHLRVPDRRHDPKPRLLWAGNPVAVHQPSGDTVATMAFRLVDTTVAAEARTLLADGLIDSYGVRRYLDGRWSVIELIVS